MVWSRRHVDHSILPHEDLKLFNCEIRSIIRNQQFQQSVLCKYVPQFTDCCRQRCWIHDQLGCSKSWLFPLLQGTSYRETVQHSRCWCESTAFQATPNSVVKQRVVTWCAVGVCHTCEPFLPAVRLCLATRHNCVWDSSCCWFLDVQDVTYATPLVDSVVESPLSGTPQDTTVLHTYLISSTVAWCHLYVDVSIWPATHKVFPDTRQRRIMTNAVSDLRCAHRRRVQFFYQQDEFLGFFLLRYRQWQPIGTA